MEKTIACLVDSKSTKKLFTMGVLSVAAVYSCVNWQPATAGFNAGGFGGGGFGNNFNNQMGGGFGQNSNQMGGGFGQNSNQMGGGFGQMPEPAGGGFGNNAFNQGMQQQQSTLPPQPQFGGMPPFGQQPQNQQMAPPPQPTFVGTSSFGQQPLQQNFGQPQQQNFGQPQQQNFGQPQQQNFGGQSSFVGTPSFVQQQQPLRPSFIPSFVSEPEINRFSDDDDISPSIVGHYNETLEQLYNAMMGNGIVTTFGGGPPIVAPVHHCAEATRVFAEVTQYLVDVCHSEQAPTKLNFGQDTPGQLSSGIHSSVFDSAGPGPVKSRMALPMDQLAHGLQLYITQISAIISDLFKETEKMAKREGSLSPGMDCDDRDSLSRTERHSIRNQAKMAKQAHETFQSYLNAFQGAVGNHQHTCSAFKHRLGSLPVSRIWSITVSRINAASQNVLKLIFLSVKAIEDVKRSYLKALRGDIAYYQDDIVKVFERMEDIKTNSVKALERGQKSIEHSMQLQEAVETYRSIYS